MDRDPQADRVGGLLEDLVTSIAPDADLGAVSRSAPLQEVLDLDSMDFLRLVTRIADETGVEIAESDYPLVSTLDGLGSYLTSRWVVAS